jgi:hypothetical protein
MISTQIIEVSSLPYTLSSCNGFTNDQNSVAKEGLAWKKLSNPHRDFLRSCDHVANSHSLNLIHAIQELDLIVKNHVLLNGLHGYEDVIALVHQVATSLSNSAENADAKLIQKVDRFLEVLSTDDDGEFGTESLVNLGLLRDKQSG